MAPVVLIVQQDFVKRDLSDEHRDHYRAMFGPNVEFCRICPQNGKEIAQYWDRIQPVAAVRT